MRLEPVLIVLVVVWLLLLLLLSRPFVIGFPVVVPVPVVVVRFVVGFVVVVSAKAHISIKQAGMSFKVAKKHDMVRAQPTGVYKHSRNDIFFPRACPTALKYYII